MDRFMLTEREVLAVLAALRLWQREGLLVMTPDGSLHDPREEAFFKGYFIGTAGPLTAGEVDNLADRIFSGQPGKGV